MASNENSQEMPIKTTSVRFLKKVEVARKAGVVITNEDINVCHRLRIKNRN